MKSIEVKVVGSDGSGAQGAEVRVWVYQTLASGALDSKYTDSDGIAEFDLDVDSDAKISISVNDKEKVEKSGIRGSYRVNL